MTVRDRRRAAQAPAPGRDRGAGPEYRPVAPGSGTRAAPALAPETRSRTEYYRALRAAEGAAAAGGDGTAAARPEASGWDGADGGSRPPLDAIQVSPERARHT